MSTKFFQLHNMPSVAPPPMSRSSSSSTITLIPSTPPAPKELQYLESPPTLDVSQFPEPPVVAPDHVCTDLSAVKVTKPIKAILSAALSMLDRPLRIVGLLATTDSGCHMYADMTARACKAGGVLFDKIDLSAAREHDDDAAFETAKTAIEDLNKDMTVDGLIVYFPLFTAEKDAVLRSLISPRIDVEGVHPTSLVRSYAHSPKTIEEHAANPARAIVYPCTALAVVQALHSPICGVYQPDRPHGERFRGKTITVINRSETVGRPLAGMLANDGARVFSVDIDSTHVYERLPSDPCYKPTPFQAGQPPLETILAESDVVVTAVPGKSFKVDTAMLRPGVVCVDLSEHGNYGADVRDHAGIYAPRLGSVTILMLKLNALVLRSQHQEKLEQEELANGIANGLELVEHANGNDFANGHSQ